MKMITDDCSAKIVAETPEAAVMAWNTRAAPTPDAHSEVGVKALEWDRDTYAGWTEAHTQVGEYRAYADGTLVLDLAQISYVKGRSWHDTEAAAQADFAQRVQSCLTAGVVKAEPVALAHISLQDDDICAELEVLDGSLLQPNMSPVKLYARPANPTVGAVKTGPVAVSYDMVDRVKQALQVIADLPTGKNEDVMEGQEQAYRAVEALLNNGLVDVNQAADHARFSRLYGICRRILWVDAANPALDNEQTKAAFEDLAQFLFMDGIDAALASKPEGER